MDPLRPDIQEVNIHTTTQFENPFDIEDLEIFDDETLQFILSNCGFGLTVEKLARSLHGVNEGLIQRIERNLLPSQRSRFICELRKSMPEALVEAEGSGRATFECVRYGARKVYAVEPSPGLLHILQKKIASQAERCCILPLQGRFDKLPLTDDSVDTALSCSAFTSDPAQGGEPGLAEFQRVIKPGGKIVIIWPRVQDYDWLAEHGFHYVALPVCEEMLIFMLTTLTWFNIY